MKKSFLKIMLILILLLHGCGFQKWARKDQVLFGSLVVLNTVDLAQYDKNNEINWFKGESQATVGLIKIAGIGLVYTLANNWEDARTPILIVGNVLFGGVILWNLTQ